MDQQILSKTCTKCGVKKPAHEFSKAKARRDGLQSACKECSVAFHRRWMESNPEKAKVYSATYRSSNSDIAQARTAAWRAANPGKGRATDAAWRAANPEKKRLSRASWRANHPEAARIHHQNRRARKKAAPGKLSKGLSAKLFKLQKGKCPCCKQPLGDDCHLDHIIPLALGGTNTDDNMQLLRAKCNLQKHAKHPVDFMRQRGFLL